jgi:hypothetical protein
MTSAALLLALLSGPTPSPEPPLPSPSVLGTGLLTLQDTRTLPRGRFTVATTLHNRDRDPLGIDVFDYSVAGAVGLTPLMEAYGSAVFSRVVVVPDFSQTWPALPPPPLDLVLPQAMPVPDRPYYAIAPPFPYANGRGDQRFSDLVPGDLVLGVKRRLREGDERRSGYAVSGEIKIPLTGRLGALQSGSGTGGVDLSLRGIAQRRFAGMDIVTSAAFTYVGGAPLADRILIANPEGSAVVEEPLRLPSRIDVGVGLRRAVSPRVAMVGEAVATMEVYGAKTLDRVSPLDLLAGLQARRGRARLTAGLLYAGGSPPSGIVRPSPLAGFVDLSRARQEEARRYLQQAGLGGAAAHIRPGAQLVTPRVPGISLPTGARLIPDTYTVISEHQLGFVFVLGWAF